MSFHSLHDEVIGRALDLRLMTRTPKPILVVVVLDCSPSMRSVLRETTRYKAAACALQDYLKILRGSPYAQRILYSLVLFDGKGRVHLPVTPLNQTAANPLGAETPGFLGSTDFYEALTAAESPIWGQAYAVRPAHLTNDNAILALILGSFFAFEEEKNVNPLPAVPCPTKLYLIADGEQTGRWSENACAALADRMKAAGVHISAQGIGDSTKFGLLRRLVSDPETDFGTHQTPESLRRTFEQMAVSLIREVK